MSGSHAISVSRSSREALERAAPLRPGDLIAGRYRIERILGIGGMGAVYEATQVAIQRRVALKVVRAELAGDPLMAARFQREARAASVVRHPNVVVVHDFGQDEHGTLFLVMELLTGASLLQTMRGAGALPPRDALRIAIEILGALEAAHDAGVVHRDLKPDNVLLLEPFEEQRGKLKVLDFGIARIAARDAGGTDDGSLTEDGQRLGTPRYMSPEAVSRRPVGPAADLYALGAIIFEMIVGRPLFTEREPVLLMGHHLRTPAPRLSDTVRERDPRLRVPPALDALVASLLAKSPAQRPHSAALVRRALLDVLADPAAFAVPSAEPSSPSVFAPPPAESVARVRSIRPRGALARALRVVPAALVVAGGAGVLYAHRVQLARERAEAHVGVVAPVVARSTASEIAAPRTEHARITVLGLPEGAQVTWDGAPMPATTFDVPLDARPHRLEASARGFRSRTVDVVADGPHQLELELVRARRIERP